MPGTVNLGQRPIACQVMGSQGEAITLVLSSRQPVPIILPSKHLCLCPKTGAALSLDYRSFCLHLLQLFQRLIIGKKKKMYEEWVTISHNA